MVPVATAQGGDGLRPGALAAAQPGSTQGTTWANLGGQPAASSANDDPGRSSQPSVQPGTDAAPGGVLAEGRFAAVPTYATGSGPNAPIDPAHDRGGDSASPGPATPNSTGEAGQYPFLAGWAEAQSSARSWLTPPAGPAGLFSRPESSPTTLDAPLKPTAETSPVASEGGPTTVPPPLLVASPVSAALDTVVTPAGRANPTPASPVWPGGQPSGPAAFPSTQVVTAPFPFEGVSPATISGSLLAASFEVVLAAARPRTAPGADAPSQAPPPRGAGLITRFLPFNLTSLDMSVSRFVDGLGDEATPGRAEDGPLPYPVLFVTAGVALEAARRWRQRLATPRTSVDWKKSSHTFLGLS